MKDNLFLAPDEEDENHDDHEGMESPYVRMDSWWIPRRYSGYPAIHPQHV